MRRPLAPALALALALALAACGGQPRPADEASHESTAEASLDPSSTGTAGSDARSAPAACPPAFDAPGPRCTPDDFVASCSYPEGTCGCSQPRWCGGAAPPPMPMQWVCERPRPPCPEAGTPCTTGSPTCSDHPCGWGMSVACVGGVWTPHSVPPPP